MGPRDLRVPGMAGTEMMKVITQSEAKRGFGSGKSKKNDSTKTVRRPKRKGGMARKDDQ